MCFPGFGLFEGEVDIEDDPEESMCERDIRRALEHLAELGFMVGLLVWGALLTNKSCLCTVWNVVRVSRPGFDVALVAYVLLWVLCINAENLQRAMKRASNLRRISNNVEHADYVQIV